MTPIEPFYAGVEPELLPHLPRTPVRVVLDNLRSAFNVGSIFRTSDAAAVEHLHLCGLSAHPPNPKVLKTALGAQDYVPWSHHRDSLELVQELAREGYSVVALENSPEATTYTEFCWPDRVALIVGHEVEGIRPELLACAKQHVQIPVLGFKRTLNVANSYSIVIYEILRQLGRLQESVSEEPKENL